MAIPCLVGDHPDTVYPLLDTGSEWCILERGVAVSLGYLPEPREDTLALHSRFGLIYGRLERIPLRLPADEGNRLMIEATWFVSADWRGPSVLGWRGCLERFRFGLDPAENWLYFAEL